MKGYKVIPFIARIKSGKSANQIADQLQEVITSNSNEEWDFVEVTSVTAEISAGCLGALLGQSNSYVRYDLVIFKSTAYGI